MINTKEINELTLAMHEPINMPGKQPIGRLFLGGFFYDCPSCSKVLYAIESEEYANRITRIMYYGGLYSVCPRCSQPIEWPKNTPRV